MRRKERERLSDGLRLKGWGKFFHGLFLFITFPIRKPLIFVPILMFGYLAPTFMGARPSEVHLWYWNKIKHYSQGLGNSISQKTQEIMPDVDSFKVSMPDMSFLSAAINNDETAEIEKAYNLTGRQMFEISKGNVNTVDALEQAQLKQKMQENSSFQQRERKTEQRAEKKKLPLIYTDGKEEILGTAEVINANELMINNKKYFLHGVYVNPTSDKGIAAKEFLKTVIAQNKISCTVRAHTYQGVGTIICIVNGENINRLLVNRGYSKDVDL